MKMTETITVTGVGAEASVSPAMTALEEKRQKKIAEEIKNPRGARSLDSETGGVQGAYCPS
jgi:hypothetical protein